MRDRCMLDNTTDRLDEVVFSGEERAHNDQSEHASHDTSK